MIHKLSCKITDKVQVIIEMRDLKQGMEASLWEQLNEAERAAFQKITRDERKIEWCEARRCIYSLKKETKNIESQNLTSIAHSQFGDLGVAAAAILQVDLSKKSGFLQNEDATQKPTVGLDLEHKDREITKPVWEWLSSYDDQTFELDPLWLWVIKESCFKADTNKASTASIREYRLKSFDHKNLTGTAVGINSHTELYVCLKTMNCWRLAVACPNYLCSI